MTSVLTTRSLQTAPNSQITSVALSTPVTQLFLLNFQYSRVENYHQPDPCDRNAPARLTRIATEIVLRGGPDIPSSRLQAIGVYGIHPKTGQTLESRVGRGYSPGRTFSILARGFVRLRIPSVVSWVRIPDPLSESGFEKIPGAVFVQAILENRDQLLFGFKVPAETVGFWP